MSDLVWSKEWPQEPGWYWTRYLSNTSIFFITSKSIAAVDPESGRLMSYSKEGFWEDQLINHSHFSDDGNTWINYQKAL